MNGPAPLPGVDPGFEDEYEEDEECDGSCEDEFCGANCPMELGHPGAHLCDYHQWVTAGCPDAARPTRRKPDRPELGGGSEQ